MPDIPQLPGFFHVHYMDTVTSTNDVAKDKARSGARPGTLIVAEQQNAGRGRTGREWTSKPGNLYMSLLLRPQGTAGDVAQISFLAALALSDAIVLIAPDLKPQHKWPNDVLIEGAKLSGILLESSARVGGGVEWLVLGLGVNVAHHPTDAGQATTSLHALGATGDQGASNCTPQTLLAVLAPRLLYWLSEWQEHGFAPLRQAWLKRAKGLNGPIRVRVGKEEFTGTFRDLDDNGNLIVELPGGTMRSIAAGEIFLPQN